MQTPSARLAAVVQFVLFAGLLPTWHQAAAQERPSARATSPVEDGSVSASTPTPEPSDEDPSVELLDEDTNHDFSNRRAPTGAQFGLRSSLQDSGVTFLNRETQFGFGVAGGVNQPVPAQLGQGNTFKYTGRGEHDAIFNLEKLVGLPKGTLLVRLENWYGEYGNVSLRTGSFAPAVFPAMLPPSPNEPGIPFLTNFLWTQPLSERLVVFAGKKDVLGSSDQDIFAGGDGTDQFVNQALIANPAFLLGLPYTSFTAGFASPRKWGGFRGFIYDPTDRTMDVFRLDNLFSRGIIVGGEIRLKTKLFRRPGQHHVGGIWKHVPLTNLAFAEPPPGVYPEPTVPGFPTIRNSYTLYYGFDQYLVQFSDSDRGWGLFGRASISDGNPTPIQYFLSCGLGGYSPFAPQRNDTFGLGWYFVGASTEFGPLPRALFGPRNGTGVELYYNFQIKSWLNITPDVQFIRPGAGAIAENAFVYGIRVNARY